MNSTELDSFFTELTETDSMMVVGGTGLLGATAGILYDGVVDTAATTGSGVGKSTGDFKSGVLVLLID